MANSRKAGRSNPDQNLDQSNTDMNQNLDKSTQSNDINERGGTQGVRGGQSQQSNAQNDSSLDADSSKDNTGV